MDTSTCLRVLSPCGGRVADNRHNRRIARQRELEIRTEGYPRARAGEPSKRTCAQMYTSNLRLPPNPHCCQLCQQQTTRFAKCVSFEVLQPLAGMLKLPETASLPKTWARPARAREPDEPVITNPRRQASAATPPSTTGPLARGREPDEPVIPSPRRRAPPAAAPVRRCVKNP